MALLTSTFSSFVTVSNFLYIKKLKFYIMIFFL